MSESLFREIERRAASMEPDLRAALLAGFRRLSEKIRPGELERLLASNSIDALVNELFSDTAFVQAFFGARKVIREGVATAASVTTANTPVLRRIGIAFDAVSPSVLDAIQQSDLAALRTLADEVKGGVRSAVERGLSEGIGPRKIARELPNVIGLTARQEQAIANFERALTSGDFGKALGYQLRDKTLDAVIKKAAESGKPLTPAQITRMVDGYRRRYKAFNAETYARTTALEAQRIGNQTAWREGMGELDDDVVVLKQWNATMDARVRPEHAAMNKATAYMDGTYTTGERYPGEANPWNCRCVETYKVVRRGREGVQPYTPSRA